MNRKAVLVMMLALTLVSLAACSANRVLPEAADEEAMEADVRAAIAAAVPGKTFGLKVDVTEGGVVTLEGHVDNQADLDAILAKVRQVNGVVRVNNQLHVQ